MALYFLSYDLRNRRDYQTLYDELKRFKAVRIVESTWCFKRDKTSAGGLRDHFKQIVHSDDAIMVSQVDGWGSYNTDGTPKDL